MSVIYKRLKYIVTGVIAEIDDDGNVIGEQTTQPQALYTREQLLEFTEKFDMDIEAANLQGSENGANPES